jgi:hypothetical protein
MKRPSFRVLFTCLVAIRLLADLPAAAQEEGGEAPRPLLTLEAVMVEPTSPAADTLCRLRVKLRNSGEQIASQLGFAVSLNGQDLGVYGNQLFMYPVAPGATEEIRLYNFWTTETSRSMPADGKLRVEVTLKEAIWTRVEMETDEEGEIEVWTPIGPVESLPVKAEVTLQMKTGG